jgi:hypothetical protein
MKPSIKYVEDDPKSKPMIYVQGLWIRQRPGIDPVYDGPPTETNWEAGDPRPIMPYPTQVAAANRVVNGSNDPDPVLTRLMKCAGFRRIEPDSNVVQMPVAVIAEDAPPIAPAPSPAKYPMAIPENAMFGKLAVLARSTRSPLSWAYPALLAYYAGLGINLHDPDPKIHPTVYVALLGNVEDGKSVTMKRTRQVLGLTPDDVFPAPNSDRGLISAFRVTPDGIALDKKEAPGPLFGGVIVADEMRELMSKMAIKGATLSQRFCELWSTDKLTAADKFGVQSMKARVSLLGNLKIKDRDEFPILFAGNTQDGFFSRMILAPGPKNWDFDWQWEPPAPEPCVEGDLSDYSAVMAYKPYPRPAGPVTVIAAAYAQLDEWKKAHRDKGVKAGRFGEIALRVAVITASANGDSQVSAECINAALAFADWQMFVKNVYVAGEGRNDEAILTGLIEDAFIEIEAAVRIGKPMQLGGKPLTNKGGYVPFHLLEKKKRWGRTFASSAVARVLAALTKNGRLEQEYQEDDKGHKKYLNRYRLNTE